MPRNLGGDLVRHPVEHGGEGDVVLLRAAEQVPGDGVGVPGGGGDEHPDVRGADEIGGQIAVARDERVDVGGVQQGEARGQGPGGDDAERGLPVALLPRPAHPAELRENAPAVEPPLVFGVADEHGRPGGGPQHPGLGDAAPDERVDEGRLPRSGRASDDGEQRRLGLAQPRQQVAVELGQQFGGRTSGALRPRQLQREAHGSETLPQYGQRVQQFGPCVQDRHMRRMPNFEQFQKHIPPNAPQIGRGAPHLRHNECATPLAQATKIAARIALACDYQGCFTGSPHVGVAVKQPGRTPRSSILCAARSLRGHRPTP